MKKKRTHSCGRFLTPVLLAALLFMGFALAAQAEETVLAPGALQPVELSAEPQTFLFTPETNSLYSVYLFAQPGAAAQAELWQGGTLMARGDGALRLFSVRLVAGSVCTLKIAGSGSAQLEVAREALSRSFDQPLALTDVYSKTIARPGDVHWYSIDAAEHAAALIAASADRPGMRLGAVLFDSEGCPVAGSETLPSGAAVLDAELFEEETYLLRVSVQNGGTGKYSLSLMTSGDLTAPESLRLSAESLVLEGMDSAELTSDAEAPVWYDSSRPEVAARLPDGRVHSRMPGETVVTAYAYGGATARCAVTVNHVPVESVSLEAETSTMAVGDDQRLTVTLLPENASDRRLTFITDDETVLSVDADGTLHANGEGTARIVVVAGEENLTDVVYVAVEPAGRRYRALLIGEENYASTVDKVRPGTGRSVESLAALFEISGGEDEKYAVTTLMDAPRDEVIAGIRTAFADAGDQDLSVIYITCHGFYQAGMTFFVMVDGSVLSAADLARELTAVKGEIVLLADCCGSGGLLGEAGETDDLLDGVNSVFQGLIGGDGRTSRISVIASARLDQDSYRISFSDDEGMATVFARALCDAAGWDIDRAAPGPMGADTDYNGDITFDELGRYLHRRVQWYLSLTGGYVQNICYFPEGGETVVLSRDS